jgi:hypothetical protein
MSSLLSLPLAALSERSNESDLMKNLLGLTGKPGAIALDGATERVTSSGGNSF